MKKGKYIDFIDCKNPEEVLVKVRKYSSSLSTDEHLIRSTILDIHVIIESRIKQILFHHMVSLVFKDADEETGSKGKDRLASTISKMSFSNAYRLLKPCFESFPHPDLKHIEKINNMRNQTAHGDIEKVRYKDRNPFRDFDCLAQIFVDSFAAEKAMSKFFERMIDDPKALLKIYKKAYDNSIT